MAIKAIIIDCFGVLVIPGGNLWYQIYPQFATEINDLEHQVDYGIINKSEFYQSMSDLLGREPEDLKTNYHSKNVLNKPMLDYMRELRKSGKYKIGMLSNAGHGWINEFFSSSEKKDLFDNILLSADVGIAKPEIAFFKLMSNRLELDPSECIMIDDKLTNIEAAKNAGMQEILYETNQQTQSELRKLLGEKSA